MQDTELIRKAQEGDWTAFGELVRRHDGAVLALAARFVQNAEDAKDIYQEVLIRVYRGLPAFRCESLFSTWIHRITVNVCLSFLRERKRSGVAQDALRDQGEEEEDVPGAEPVSDAIAPDRRAMDSEIRQRVAQALLILPPQQRMVFSLYHEQEYTLKEIAQTLECAEGTVKRYLFEATRTMRSALRDLL